MTPYFSIVSLYTYILRRTFISAGLSKQSIDIDNETTLHFWSPKNPNPKPALLLIHGFGPLSLWQWRHQVKFFASTFNLYIPDLIFFGDSTTSSPRRSEVFQAESVGKLMEKLGVEKYSVVGTSYGGFVTYHMATMWPEKVEKAVIASSGVNMRWRDNEELVKRAELENVEKLMLPQTANDLRALARLAVFKRPGFHVPDFFLNDFVKTLYKSNRKEKVELLKGLTLGKDNSVNLSPLQQEVLIVWGDQDKIFPLEMGHELKGLLGEKVRMEVIKGTSHCPQTEDPVQFNNIVKQFLCGS
ncbi:hypothetical protein ACFE04_016217 [Oxalis oulophora]